MLGCNLEKIGDGEMQIGREGKVFVIEQTAEESFMI